MPDIMLPISSCQGCTDVCSITPVWLIHKPTGQIMFLWACAWCLEVVDNCDPVTGSYGAAACEHRRATAEEVARAESQTRAA